jgi:signal transduction histidine kinase
LSNDLDPQNGLYSVLAAPILFRSSITGVLAVANGARPYTSADLDLLQQTARIAVLEHETLQHTEALGLDSPRQRTANLVHKLRQPLGVLEACAFYLDLIIPAGESKPREQLAQMQRQINRASVILDESSRVHPPCSSDRLLDVAEPAEDESLILTNSAMSMVT